MSLADHIFIDMCNDILTNGTSTEGEKVRPHWPDGTPAYTIKKFGVVNRYDLSKEFPILTLRRTALKSATDEMLWIWQRKSNNIHDLNSHVWDEWADENGSIGKAYGYQMQVKHQYKEGMMDQVDRVIYDLKNNPFSRRIMTNIYVHQDLHEMNLYPCAYSMTFNVTQKKGEDRLTLNAILNQRSQDVLAANNWNVVQYAVLVYMLAQVCDMNVGELVHVIADAHIYDRHVDAIKELISREPFPAPKFWLNPEIKDFYQFTDEQADVAIAKYREYFSKQGIFENTLYQGIDELLRLLTENEMKIYLATSKPQPFAQQILEYFHLESYFTFVGGSTFDGNRSEKANVIQYVLDSTDIKTRSDVVMIGDRKYDIKGAKANNIDSIGVLYGYGDEEELANAGANKIVTDIKELSSFLLTGNIPI